ncbi:hypothetical protein F4819DRAFT_281722 [Hypoxylon fuscum]|nr:hypothetical protein F4819DRAFT_281722 [Hypoxylon fuscum]
MAYIWGVRALQLAAAVLAVTTSATSIRPSMLLERADDTCAATNYSRCTQSGLPDNFCCESGATCIVLAANTTVLCCPKGSNCDKIGPITCDLALQDPVVNPTAEVRTTVLDGVLTKCGSQCCPFGYHCDGVNCVIDTDQSKKPSTTPKPTTASSTSAPTSTAHKTASTTVAVTGITTAAPSSNTPVPSAGSTASTTTIVGGVIGGVIGLVLIVVAVVLCCFRRKRRRQQEDELQRHDTTSSFGNIISAPVPHANFPNQRIDFLAKQSQTTGSPRSTLSSPTAVASSHHQPHEHEYGFMPPNSPYARRPVSEMSDAPRSYHQSAEITGLRSLTHGNGKKKVGTSNLNDLSPAPAPLNVTVSSPVDDWDRRHPSAGSESINIFADPKTFYGRPESAATTWSNIQQRADNRAGPSAPPLGDSPLRRR